MAIKKLRYMPPSGYPPTQPIYNHTPRCESKVQVIGNHTREWRLKRYGEEFDRCTRPATVELDGVNLCRRHAGERVLEMYLEGELIEKSAFQDDGH